MGNLLARMHSQFPRRHPESSAERAAANRFQWANEQGGVSSHLVEGGPLLHHLGSWPDNGPKAESEDPKRLAASTEPSQGQGMQVGTGMDQTSSSRV